MAKRELPVEIGNLVCKFGAKNLLDYFEEIVFPAFKDGNLKRAYGQTTYFFEDVRITSIHNRAVLVGRLIKDTVLEREQVYVPDKGLIHDDEEMRSSPSSVFALILDVHRIILAKETKFAPDLKLFKLALESFLREKYAEYINIT